MPKSHRRETYYQCCECHAEQRWEKSRCDSILSDGRPCNHGRHERHCRVFRVTPNRNDHFPTPHAQGLRSVHDDTTVKASPSPPSWTAETENPADALRKAYDGRRASKSDHALQQPATSSSPRDAVDQNLILDSPTSQPQTQLDTGRRLSPADETTQSLPESHGNPELIGLTNEPTPVSSSNNSSSQAVPQTSSGTSPAENTASIGHDLRAAKRTRSKNTSRPKYGTRIWDTVDNRWSLACPYDKFLPEHSDCVRFACRTEQDLHRRHMQTHVQERDISKDEYTRLTRARNFRPFEANNSTAQEQDWKHWRKQFVAIYPVFKEIEACLNPEKDRPLLEDTRLFEDLRRRQIRCFEDSGSPLPYAYLPRRHELADMNARWLVSSRSSHPDDDTPNMRPLSGSETQDGLSSVQERSASRGGPHALADDDDHTDSGILPSCSWSASSPFEDLDGLDPGFVPSPLAMEENNINGTPSSVSSTDVPLVFSPELRPVCPGYDLGSTPATELPTLPVLTNWDSESEGDATPTPQTQQYNSTSCDLVGYRNQPPMEQIGTQDEDDEFTELMALKRSEERLEAWRKTEPKRQKLLEDFQFVDDDID